MIESVYLFIFYGIQEPPAFLLSPQWPHGLHLLRGWQWKRASAWSPWSHDTPTCVHVWNFGEERTGLYNFFLDLCSFCSLGSFQPGSQPRVILDQPPWHLLSAHSGYILPYIWELRRCRWLLRKPFGSDTNVKKSFCIILRVAPWITQMIKRLVHILIPLFLYRFLCLRIALRHCWGKRSANSFLSPGIWIYWDEFLC